MISNSFLFASLLLNSAFIASTEAVEACLFTEQYRGKLASYKEDSMDAYNDYGGTIDADDTLHRALLVEGDCLYTGSSLCNDGSSCVSIYRTDGEKAYFLTAKANSVSFPHVLKF